MFTPEIKAHFERILSGNIPAAMQQATNEFPVFPEKILKKIAQWTNSALIPAQIPRLPDVTVSNTNSPAPPVFITRIDSDPKHIRPRSQSAKDIAKGDSDSSDPASVDPRDKPIGFRGWLVIGLLAIAAFLTYRFIRLRLGS